MNQYIFNIFEISVLLIPLSDEGGERDVRGNVFFCDFGEAFPSYFGYFVFLHCLYQVGVLVLVQLGGHSASL